MRFILSLIGTICIGPALSSGLAQTNAGLLPAPLVILTPTNQTKLMAILTVTNTFPGSIEGRAYVVPSANRFVLASGTAVVSWSAAPEREASKSDFPMSPMMIFRYGLGTKFEIEGGGKSTVTVTSGGGLPPTNGMGLVVQYLPPGMKEATADWSKCRVWIGTFEGLSQATP